MRNDVKDPVPDGAIRLIETIGDTERAALDAVRSFVETVEGAFPDLGDDGPRRKIIESAFRMTEQLVGASNAFATTIVKTTESTIGAAPRSATPPEEWLG